MPALNLTDNNRIPLKGEIHMTFTEGSTMLLGATFNRRNKVLDVIFRNSPDKTYSFAGISRYRRDKIVKGAINGSVGQSMWAYVLGQ